MKKTRDGAESNDDGNKNVNSSGDSKPPKPSPHGGITIADTTNEAGKRQPPQGNKGGGHDNNNGLFVAGGQQEWEILLALFSSNLCFATEGPGRNNDHFDSAEDAEEKGQDKESKKGTDDGTHDPPEMKREKSAGRNDGEAGEEKTLERCATLRRHPQ